MKVPEQFSIDYIDCSGLECFARCPFRYMLSRLMGLTPPDAPKNFFDYGKILHECLPLVYENPFETVWARFEDLWAKQGFEGDDKRNPEAAHLLLRNFWEARNNSCPYEIVKLDIPKLNVVDSVSPGEIPFLIDIGAGIPFAGRIDMPVRLKQTKTLWAMDYKTTQDTSARFFEGFEHHPQSLGYPIALSMLTGEHVSGLIVEAVRVAPIPKRPSTAAPNHWHPVYLNELKMNWFVSWVQQKASEILFYNAEQDWPRNLCGCSSYAMFGIPGSTCQYQTVCGNYGESWYEFVQKAYRRDPWHPFVLADNPSDKPAE